MKSVSVLENPYSKKPLIDSFELEELKTELPLIFSGYNNANHLYKMEIGNPTNVEMLKLTGFTAINGNFAMAINGRVYIEGYNSGYYLYVINLDTNEILKVEASRILGGSSYPCYTPVLNEPMLWYGSYGSWSNIGYFIMANYLATINNLSEPVTKTADKTMKVTYIIQEQ